jgi:H+/gluconate symporter-like permease
MRSLFAATFVGLGGVALAFGVVVFILTFAVSRVDPSQGLHGRLDTAIVSTVLGLVVIGAGVLLRKR